MLASGNVISRRHLHSEGRNVGWWRGGGKIDDGEGAHEGPKYGLDRRDRQGKEG